MTAAPPSPQPHARDIGRTTELKVTDALASLQEVLCDAAFATALVLLIAVNKHEPELQREFADGIE
jgi:hypothetical protein